MAAFVLSVIVNEYPTGQVSEIIDLFLCKRLVLLLSLQ